VLPVLLVLLGAAPGLANAGLAPGPTPTEQANLRVYRDYIAAENAGDFARLAGLLDGGYRGELNGSPLPGQGPEVEVGVLRSLRAAFPDYRAEVEQVIAHGEFVVARWRISGTHRGELSGLPATNRRIGLSGCSLLQLRDGKIVRGFSYSDTGSLLLQLGVVRLLSIVLVAGGGILGALAAVLALFARRRWVRSDGAPAIRYGVTGLIAIGAVIGFSALASLLLMLLGRALPA
jgi:steroid delta-isomerase-like uncharacterized protein